MDDLPTLPAKHQQSLSRLLTEIDELLEFAEGEITPDIQKRFDLVIAKVDRCAFFLEYAKNREAFLRERSAAFQKAALQTNNIITSFKSYLASHVQKHGDLEGEEYKLSMRLNPKKLLLTDINKIPKEFLITEVKVDTQALKAALLQGVEVPGASLAQDQSLQVKPRKT